MTHLFDRTVTDVALELFGASGWPVKVAPANGLKSSLEVASVTASRMVFGGKQLSGSLLIAAPFEVIAACRPFKGSRQELSRSSAGDWIYVRDWTKELANQLLGRIKNRLVQHDVVLDSGVPTALNGPSAMAEIKAQPRPPLRLGDGNSKEVLIWFDATTKPGISLTLSERKQTVPREGDVILF